MRPGSWALGKTPTEVRCPSCHLISEGGSRCDILNDVGLHCLVKVLFAGFSILKWLFLHFLALFFGSQSRSPTHIQRTWKWGGQVPPPGKGITYVHYLCISVRSLLLAHLFSYLCVLVWHMYIYFILRVIIQYSIIYFVAEIISGSGHWEIFQVDPDMPPWQKSILCSLNMYLASSTTRTSRLILYFLCPITKISYFSKEPRLLVIEVVCA